MIQRPELNVDQFCRVYDGARTVTLKHSITDRAPDLERAVDVDDVNRMIGNTVPMLLELHRRRDHMNATTSDDETDTEKKMPNDAEQLLPF